MGTTQKLEEVHSSFELILLIELVLKKKKLGLLNSIIYFGLSRLKLIVVQGKKDLKISKNRILSFTILEA